MIFELSLQHRNDMKKNKDYLVEALTRLALAYADMKIDEDSTKNFNDTLKRLSEWKSDIDGALSIERDLRSGRLGMALKCINQLLSKDTKEDKTAIKPLSRAELLQKRADVFEKLGYKVLVEYDKSSRVISCPKAYALF